MSAAREPHSLEKPILAHELMIEGRRHMEADEHDQDFAEERVHEARGVLPEILRKRRSRTAKYDGGKPRENRKRDAARHHADDGEVHGAVNDGGRGVEKGAAAFEAIRLARREAQDEACDDDEADDAADDHMRAKRRDLGGVVRQKLENERSKNEREQDQGGGNPMKGGLKRAIALQFRNPSVLEETKLPTMPCALTASSARFFTSS
jgi:hypothetical protein